MRRVLLLSRFVEWPELLTIVRPNTLVPWHRNLCRLFWRLKFRQRDAHVFPLTSSDLSRR